MDLLRDPGPVLVLGDGGWGTALALVLHGRGHEVRIWAHDPEYARTLEERRENPRFLPGVEIPAGIRIASDAAALDAGVRVVVSVIPTQFLRGVIARLRSSLRPPALLVSCSKGLEVGTLKRPSEILAEVWSGTPIVVLSGPSHAEEVSRELPTAVVAAAADPDAAACAQFLFNGPRFRAYTGSDPIGVEVGGASKNVIAIATGIADGLGFGDNTRAGLMTRGLREMTRLGVALGARPETFSGLSGMGDLIATATSPHSRNRAVGLRIGRGETLEEILRSTVTVAEGVESTRSFHQLAERLGVEIPITREVYAVLFRGKRPPDAVEALMSRQSGDEVGWRS
jgi:glycerol-3-phosphate dehydrogenase (NAD(P)+)